MTKSSIKIFNEGIFEDKRGSVRFFNDFNFKDVKRFYIVENKNTKLIRAFHGHMREAKYVYVISGSILLCIVFLDDIQKPSKNNKVEKFILRADDPKIVYIPPSYTHGFRALEPDSKVIFFSTATLEESLADDYRHPENYWGTKVWEVDDR